MGKITDLFEYKRERGLQPTSAEAVRSRDMLVERALVDLVVAIRRGNPVALTNTAPEQITAEAPLAETHASDIATLAIDRAQRAVEMAYTQIGAAADESLRAEG